MLHDCWRESESLQIVQKYKQVIDYISRHNPGDATDEEAVDSLFAELISKDEMLFDAVIASQERLAKKFDFELQ